MIELPIYSIITKPVSPYVLNDDDYNFHMRYAHGRKWNDIVIDVTPKIPEETRVTNYVKQKYFIKRHNRGTGFTGTINITVETSTTYVFTNKLVIRPSSSGKDAYKFDDDIKIDQKIYNVVGEIMDESKLSYLINPDYRYVSWIELDGELEYLQTKKIIRL